MRPFGMQFFLRIHHPTTFSVSRYSSVLNTTLHSESRVFHEVRQLCHKSSVVLTVVLRLILLLTKGQPFEYAFFGT